MSSRVCADGPAPKTRHDVRDVRCNQRERGWMDLPFARCRRPDLCVVARFIFASKTGPFGGHSSVS